jgi:hypothetical protein
MLAYLQRFAQHLASFVTVERPRKAKIRPTSTSPAYEGIAATRTSFADQLVPSFLAERTVNQPPEFTKLKTTLLSHQCGKSVVDLSVITRCSRYQCGNAINFLLEHMVMFALVGNHPLSLQCGRNYASSN